MSLDLETPGTDVFLGKGDREGGKGLSCSASEGDMVGPVGKSGSFTQSYHLFSQQISFEYQALRQALDM